MHIDIIIPIYNSKKYIQDALDSCYNQSYKNFSIYLIDDNSSEDYSDILSKNASIIYHKLDKNMGPAYTRNYGALLGKGEIISFLDADDIWLPKKLELSIKEFEKDKDVGLTCGNYQRIFNRQRLSTPFYKRPFDINYSLMLKQNYIASGSVSLRRNIFQELNGFNNEYWVAEDYDLWLRVSEKYKIKYIHQVLYLYSVIPEGNSLTHRKDILAKANSNMNKIREESLFRTKNGEFVIF